MGLSLKQEPMDTPMSPPPPLPGFKQEPVSGFDQATSSFKFEPLEEVDDMLGAVIANDLQPNTNVDPKMSIRSKPLPGFAPKKGPLGFKQVGLYDPWAKKWKKRVRKRRPPKDGRIIKRRKRRVVKPEPLAWPAKSESQACPPHASLDLSYKNPFSG